MDSQTKDEYDVQRNLAEQQQYNQMMGQSHLQQQQSFGDKSVIISQISPTLDLENIERNLRGQVLDKDGEIIQKYEPLMNDLGISRMMTIVRGVLNQNTVISHLDENQISPLIEALGNDLVDDLFLNVKVYGIKEKSNLDIINNIVLVPVFLALRRCVLGGERNFLKTQTSELVSRPPEPLKKGGFFSNFKL